MDPRTGLGWMLEGASLGQLNIPGMRYNVTFRPRSAQVSRFQAPLRPSLRPDQYILTLPGMSLFVDVLARHLPPASTDRVSVFINNNIRIYDGSWIALVSTARHSSKMIPHGGNEFSHGWEKVPFDASPLLTSARNQTVSIPEPFILRLPGLGAIPIVNAQDII